MSNMKLSQYPALAKAAFDNTTRIAAVHGATPANKTIPITELQLPNCDVNGNVIVGTNNVCTGTGNKIYGNNNTVNSNNCIVIGSGITIEAGNNGKMVFDQALYSFPKLDVNGNILNSVIKPDFARNTGAQLNGTSQYYSVPHNSNIQGDVFTLEWFGYINASANVEYLITKGLLANSFSLAKEGNNKLSVKVMGNGEADKILVNTLAALTSGFYHVVVTIDGKSASNCNIYINGRKVAVTTVADTLTVSLNNTDSFLLGGRVSVYLQNGSVILARYYNYALSAAEVATLWNAGRPAQYRLPYAMLGASNTYIFPVFDFSDSTNWYLGSGWVISGGVLAVNNASNPSSAYKIGIAGITGKKYQITYTIKSYTSGSVRPLVFGASGITRNAAGTYTDIITASSGSNSVAYFQVMSSNTTLEIGDVSVLQVGATLSLQPDNIYQDKWIDNSTNNNHATPVGSPIILTQDQFKESDQLSDYMFATNIAAGTANKDFTLPAGYFVEKIQVSNGNVGSLTNVQAVSDATGTPVTLFSGKTIAAGGYVMYTNLADQTIYTSNKTLRFNATGNSVAMSIIVFIKRGA